MRLGLISDLHWMRKPPAAAGGWHGAGADFSGVLGRLAAALEHFAVNDVDRIVLAGDLAHHGDLESQVEVIEAMGAASAPVLVVAGNHDVTDDPERLARALTEVRDANVSLAEPEGTEERGLRVAGVHVGRSEAWFSARLRALPRVGDWGAKPVLLVSHYPVVSLATEVAERGLPYPGDLLDRAELAARLVEHPAPVVVVGGHLHVRATATLGSILQLSAGALVEPPYECALVDLCFEEDGALVVRRSCWRLLGEETSSEPVFSPADEAWGFEGDRWVATASTGPNEPVAVR